MERLLSANPATQNKEPTTKADPQVTMSIITPVQPDPRSKAQEYERRRKWCEVLQGKAVSLPLRRTEETKEGSVAEYGYV